MAPVSRKLSPKRVATALDTLDLPDPLGPSTATTMRRCRVEGGTAYSFWAGRGVVVTTRGAARESPDGPGRLPPDGGGQRIGAAVSTRAAVRCLVTDGRAAVTRVGA